MTAGRPRSNRTRPIVTTVLPYTSLLLISTTFTNKQQAFLDFVLAHYISEGVHELDKEKLTPLLRLKYHDSVSDLGQPDQIGHIFSSFQKYFYQPPA